MTFNSLETTILKKKFVMYIPCIDINLVNIRYGHTIQRISKYLKYMKGSRNKIHFEIYSFVFNLVSLGETNFVKFYELFIYYSEQILALYAMLLLWLLRYFNLRTYTSFKSTKVKHIPWKSYSASDSISKCTISKLLITWVSFALFMHTSVLLKCLYNALKKSLDIRD